MKKKKQIKLLRSIIESKDRESELFLQELANDNFEAALTLLRKIGEVGVEAENEYLPTTTKSTVTITLKRYL